MFLSYVLMRYQGEFLLTGQASLQPVARLCRMVGLITIPGLFASAA